METMKFKTSAKCNGCVAAIGVELNKLMNANQWHIYLSDPDKVLEVTADVAPEKVIAAVKAAGFRIEQM
jgi:copper chaperone